MLKAVKGRTSWTNFGSRILPSIAIYKCNYSDSTISVQNKLYKRDEFTNIPNSIIDKLDNKLYKVPHHPLNLLKAKIDRLLPGFKLYQDQPSIVTVEQNFDKLLVPKDHISRSKSDSFYLNQQFMLKTHTTTDELSIYPDLEVNKFSIVSDVYRRDEIDRTHYPCFHQFEGVNLFKLDDINSINENSGNVNDNVTIVDESSISDIQSEHTKEEVEFLVRSLKLHINRILIGLFGHIEGLKIKWVSTYFPFTEPSYEVEIWFNGSWLEVLGCGVLKQSMLDSNCREGYRGWAFGLGLERLAMVLHDIDDIRTFWSKDVRFLNQFQNSTLLDVPVQYKKFSHFPPCPKDVTFWLGDIELNDNDLFDLVRDLAGDLVEEVKLVDQFTHPKTGRNSRCYRTIYRSMDRNVTNEEINKIQADVRKAIVDKFKVELR